MNQFSSVSRPGSTPKVSDRRLQIDYGVIHGVNLSFKSYLRAWSRSTPFSKKNLKNGWQKVRLPLVSWPLMALLLSTSLTIGKCKNRWVWKFDQCYVRWVRHSISATFDQCDIWSVLSWPSRPHCTTTTNYFDIEPIQSCHEMLFEKNQLLLGLIHWISSSHADLMASYFLWGKFIWLQTHN